MMRYLTDVPAGHSPVAVANSVANAQTRCPPMLLAARPGRPGRDERPTDGTAEPESRYATSRGPTTISGNETCFPAALLSSLRHDGVVTSMTACTLAGMSTMPLPMLSTSVAMVRSESICRPRLWRKSTAAGRLFALR